MRAGVLQPQITAKWKKLNDILRRVLGARSEKTFCYVLGKIPKIWVPQKAILHRLLPEEKITPTPSQLDGLGIDTETDLRIYGCELIQTAGILLKLPQVAMATGQVLLQRFYYSKSLVRHPVDHTAMACVCLASKIEEAPRRVRDVISVFTHIRQVNSNKITLVYIDADFSGAPERLPIMALKGLCVKSS
ncbi:hypothetical protein NQ317_011504 [Molorchus minor]|uniref:Cyclin-like domain-containing protein n=1 Tax=Molorchus minor TaxID=1323400 RepID=A0ABQ9JB78_9CUCU|nr:hypothetical protein NQ317_011504 [Molorchus minor]